MKRFVNFLYFSAPVLPLLFCAAMLLMSKVFGPLNVDGLDRSTLVWVMKLRNFQALPLQTQNELTARSEAEFGRSAKQKPLFQFSGAEKKIYAYFRSNASTQPSVFENNLMLMARIRYFQWMTAYETGTPEAKAALMREIVRDMKYWQEIYLDFLYAADLPVPTLAELIQEFEKMIDGFKKDAAPVDAARIDTFKYEMNRAIAANEVQGAVQKVSDKVRSTFSEAVETLFPGSGKKKQQEKK
ncbi:MAG: hypothetical protein LBN39_03470 [Planctomycetaceae bacterium]|nr:hypothetical protein [Planctomycetaceae bacterium]